MVEARPVEARRCSRLRILLCSRDDLDVAEAFELGDDLVDLGGVVEREGDRDFRGGDNIDHGAKPLKHLKHRTHKTVAAEHPRRLDSQDGDVLFVGDRFDLVRSLGTVGDTIAHLVGLEGVADAHRNRIIDRRFDRFRVQNLSTKIGEFGRFFVLEPELSWPNRKFAGRTSSRRVMFGSSDLQFVRTESGGNYRGRIIRATAAQSGFAAAIGCDKSAHDRDFAGGDQRFEFEFDEFVGLRRSAAVRLRIRRR